MECPSLAPYLAVIGVLGFVLLAAAFVALSFLHIKVESEFGVRSPQDRGEFWGRVVRLIAWALFAVGMAAVIVFIWTYFAG